MPVDNISQPIQRDFQVKFILKFAMAVTGVFLAAAFLLFLLLYGKWGDSYFDSISFLSHLNRNLLKYLLLSFIFQFAFVTVTTIIITLFASHKIAGPLFRLEQTCKQIARGDLPGSIRIRADDQIQSLARSMDDFVQELKERLKTIVFHNDNIRKKCKKINEYGNEKKPELIQKEFKTLKTEVTAVKETLDSFRVE